MKQCPNPDCIIYTRLDELPDTYTRCPQCGEELVDAPATLSTGRLGSGALPSDLTFPYKPPTNSAPQPRRPAAPASHVPVTPAPNEYEDEYPAYGQFDFEDTDAEPLRTLPPKSSFPLRAFIGGVGVLALLIACLVAALVLRGRISPSQTAAFSSADATQTAVAWLRPAVNTPISLLPTIAVAGDTGQPALPGPVAGSAPPPTTAPVQAPQNTQPGSQGTTASVPTAAPIQPSTGVSVPVQDALMCVRLEKGQPVGSTTAYKPTDPFNLAVRTDYGPGGAASVLTRWYGPDGAKIYELKKTYAQQGNYYAGFTLTKNSAWTAGDYRVDIFTNDAAQPASSVQFSVIP